MWTYQHTDELCHYGILGMKWGKRRYQNNDGSLTKAGKQRYSDTDIKSARKDTKRISAERSQLNKDYKYATRTGDANRMRKITEQMSKVDRELTSSREVSRLATRGEKVFMSLAAAGALAVSYQHYRAWDYINRR